MNLVFKYAKIVWNFYVKITKPIGHFIQYAVFSLTYAIGVGLAALALKFSKKEKKQTAWDDVDQSTDSKENWMRSF